MLEPFIFNAIKHHAGYIVQQIKQCNIKNDKLQLLEALKHTGSTTLDLYFGKLSQQKIIEQIKLYLQNNRVFALDTYREWILAGKGYRKTEISDGSSWTLRFLEKKTYIHLHPSRYSQLSVRVHANNLKTVIAFLTISPSDQFSIENINLVRNRYLQLPAISPKQAHKGMNDLFELFLELMKNHK